jgi:hypothetical protein
MDPKIGDKWIVTINEGGIDYNLIIRLYKSRLNIEDEEGNKIAVDKRRGKIKIQKWGNVEWHREKS